jgi:tRNA A-37 threonylcarbamoyl transferase component Bud32
VRFVDYDGALYALKELPEPLAEREFRLLRELAAASVPVVEAAGVVSGRDQLDAVLITRHLEFSLPYRTLFTQRAVSDLHNRLIDAVAELLVPLHLAGFFWGDCSLSNTLFRRSAGEFAAYLVDAETGELHEQLSDGQRAHDLDTATGNLFAETMDLQAGGLMSEDIDPFELVDQLQQRYDVLWGELTGVEDFTTEEMWRIEQRIARLNELGFDVDELDIVTDWDGATIRIQPKVVEAGHHARRLQSLTGLDVEENQARRMLNDLKRYRVALEKQEGRPLSESVVASRWRDEVFEPTISAVPDTGWARLPAAEVFHQVLEHRWFLSEKAGKDVGIEEAVRSYVDAILPKQPPERIVFDAQ